MKTNKMVGLILGAIIAFSGLAMVIYAPAAPKIRPGEYSGQTIGKIVDFRDYVWAVPTYYDFNGLPVAGYGGEYAFVYVNDYNAMVEALRERNIDFVLRDAIVQIRVNLGEDVDLNVLGYVLPTHNVGDTVTVNYYVAVRDDGSIDGRALEVTPLTGG